MSKMNKLTYTIFVSVLLMSASEVTAELVEYNGYTLDESTNIVSDGNLEWLQWDVTRGMSIDTALAEIADGDIDGVDYGTGWALASNFQMATLFNVFGLGADFVWDSDEQTEQWSLDPANNNDGAIEDISTDPELQFTALFGETENFLPEADNHFSASRAFFGNDLDGDLFYNRAEVFDDFMSEAGIVTGNTWLRLDFTTADFSWDAAGIALVRQSNNSQPVSEPAALLLMACGLIGMFYSRKRKVKTPS